MLTNEEIALLPQNPEMAFVELDNIARSKVLEKNVGRNDWQIERAYVNYIFAFVDENDVKIELNRNVPFDDGGFNDYYHEFLQNIEYYKARFVFSERKKINAGLVTEISLDNDSKGEIHNLLNRIRIIVSEMDLSDSKKDAVFSKISALALEIDKKLTRSDYLFSLYLDITTFASEGAKNLDPVIDRVERVIKIFGRAKANQERGKLPAPEEKKLLTAPKLDKSNQKSLDDEIPF